MIMNYKSKKEREKNNQIHFSSTLFRHFMPGTKYEEWGRGRTGALLRIQIHRGANEKWSRFRFVYGERFFPSISFFFTLVTPC